MHGGRYCAVRYILLPAPSTAENERVIDMIEKILRLILLGGIWYVVLCLMAFIAAIFFIGISSVFYAAGLIDLWGEDVLAVPLIVSLALTVWLFCFIRRRIKKKAVPLSPEQERMRRRLDELRGIVPPGSRPAEKVKNAAAASGDIPVIERSRER